MSREKLATRSDGSTDFFLAYPDDLDAVVGVPQAFDNQWMPDQLLGRALLSRRRPSDVAVERRRLPYVRREYLRALVNTGQVVINRAFLYNNEALYRDFVRAGAGRTSFKHLLDESVIVPYLFSEPSPVTPTQFSVGAGWQAWLEVMAESVPVCLRLSWESDQANADLIRRTLSTPTARFIETLHYMEPDVLASDFGLPAADCAALSQRLREVADWGRQRSAAGESLNREDVYKAFVVADNTEPSDRRYDGSKPFSGVVKQLIDLRYNANLADALGSYLLSPEDSLRRRALQEWISPQNTSGSTDAAQVLQMIKNLRFDQITEVTGALAAFDQLTLGGIIELRSTSTWESYYSTLKTFLAQQTLDAFGNPEHGAEAVARAYREVIREAGAIAAQHSADAIGRRWDPVVEITVEFAGALLSVLYNPSGTGGNVFRVIHPVATNVATRSAKAVFHLVVGGVTRSRGRSQVDNNLRVLETRLEHGRRDWDELVRALELEGFRNLSERAREEKKSAMEKSVAA